MDEILQISTDAAQGRNVRNIVLKVGALSCVMPEALQFCFDSCKAGSVLQDAQLILDIVPGLGCCKRCGTEYLMQELYQPCECGSCDRTILQGQELLIQTLEYE